MKLIKALAAVAISAIAVSSFAATASNLDLVIGFKQTGATSNVEIDLGNVSSYTAPGTYSLGNFNDTLTQAFTSAWSTSTTLNWAAAAANYNNGTNYMYLTSKWGTAAGTLGVANSTDWGATASNLVQGKLDIGAQRVTAVYNGIGSYTLGTANLVTASGGNSWSTQTSSSLFNYTAATGNNQTGRLAAGENYSASDLYRIDAGVSSLVGTFAVYQNGDITFTVIPEPSTYAMVLGALTVGFVALRRRFVKAAV